MRLDHFTVKSQEALERAQRLARDRGHQELAPEHLLGALLDEPEGIPAALLEKLGVSRETLIKSVDQAIDRLPRVQGGSMYLGETLRQVLERGEAEAQRLKDEYVSVEHLLIALASPDLPTDAHRALAQ